MKYKRKEMYLRGYSYSDAARETGCTATALKYRVINNMVLNLPDRFEELLPRERFILFIKAHGLKRVDVARYFNLTMYQYESFRRKGVNFDILKKEIELIIKHKKGLEI